jgi:hypothetical protein
MFKKGNPGKQPGIKNKSTRTIEETAKRLKCDPFEIMCLFAIGDWEALKIEPEEMTADMRLRACEQACKYLYAQKRAIDLGTGDKSIKIVIEDWTKKK